MPVAHKQDANRSGSEDLDENFNVCTTSFCRATLAFNFILVWSRRILRQFAAACQGTPGEGSLRRNRPPDTFGYPPALHDAKVFRALRGAPGALPLDPTIF